MKELLLSSDAFAQTVRETVSRGETILISGTGTSMEPLIRADRDAVLLAPLPDRPLLAGDIVLYRRANGQTVLHRICRVRKDGYDMLGDGQLWVEQRVKKEQLIAFAREIRRPEGVLHCDTPQERKRACREMKRKIRSRYPHPLIRFGKRSLRYIRRKLKGNQNEKTSAKNQTQME